MAPASTPQMGAATPMGSQNFGFRGPGVPNVSPMQQPIRPSQTAALPSQVTADSLGGQTQTMSSGGIAPHPPQPMPAGPNVPNPNISTDWLSGKTSGPPAGPRSGSPSAPRSVSPSSGALSSQSLVSSSPPSGNGFAADSGFGGDMFSAVSPTIKQDPSVSTNSASSSSALSASVPVSRAAQPLAKSNSLDSLQGALSMQSPASVGSQIQRNQSSLNAGQQLSAQSSPSFASSGQPPSGTSFASPGQPPSGTSFASSGQPPWPKMKPSDIQKYSKVFMEVDTDRDGRITGEQARNLFMSWRLPRDVLKQVWDLSDQDSDSMLSLREFCFALYLMERYREGRPLPEVLPRNVMFDETLLSMTGQPNAAYGNPAWGPSPGFGQQVMVPRSMTPTAGLRPPVAGSNPTAGAATVFNQQKLRAPELDNSFANQLGNGEQNLGNSEVQEETAAGKKVGGTEKVILDSREKIEFYRSKMQELVLYKSRCDNRLNEITERALADKREAELLGKKYEEKYKQVAEIASKLTIEEAKFRELQERKMELHQAIVNMERGGSADGLLQVRADRIQSDLEELLKALTERCKKHGLDVKSSALIELPFGWQPGIQEGAAVWDEEWDKFEDEGFGNELTFDGKNASASPNEKASGNGNMVNTGEHAVESESAYSHSEDELARSPHDSPAGRSTVESPSHEFSDSHFGRNTEADAETHRSFDESTWGAFDNNDDTDSVWGFNPVNTKVSDSDNHRDFFGSSDFDANSIRTESPSADSTFRRKSPFTFDDSVPSTPLSRFGNSSPRYSDVSAADHFDSFSRFDSFGMHESGFSSQPDKLARFDSINSTKDFGASHFGTDKFSRFDSINSTKDFGSEKLARFDSMNSTKDFGNSPAFYSFDETDPFGSSGPFKVSTDTSSKDKF